MKKKSRSKTNSFTINMQFRVVFYNIYFFLFVFRVGPTGVTHSLSFIIKLLPQDPFSRFFVTEAQFDLREIKFYTQVSIVQFW